MKVVILAGGRGSRLSEETCLKPKPMVEIGGLPILWHIMKIYSYYGYNEFLICCGYKGEMIKEYFTNYYVRNSDITIDLKDNSYFIHENVTEPWKVTLVDTGLETNTAGRIMKIKKYVGEEAFMLTYGDGVSDVNLTEVLKFHKKHNQIATITVAKPVGRWGEVKINEDTDLIETFREKNKKNQAWVNSGFAVFEPEIFQYLTNENQQLEREPFSRLVSNKELNAYRHIGFWHAMDTVNDRTILQEYWESGHAPWKIW